MIGIKRIVSFGKFTLLLAVYAVCSSQLTRESTGVARRIRHLRTSTVRGKNDDCFLQTQKWKQSKHERAARQFRSLLGSVFFQKKKKIVSVVAENYRPERILIITLSLSSSFFLHIG